MTVIPYNHATHRDSRRLDSSANALLSFLTAALGDRHFESYTLHTIANVQLTLGEAARALELYSEALKISKELGTPRGEGVNSYGAGMAHCDLGELDLVIEHLEHALARFRAQGDTRAIRVCEANLAAVYVDQGELARAREIYGRHLEHAREQAEAALDIARVAGDSELQVEVGWTLGLALAATGQVEHAREVMQARIDYETSIDHARLAEHRATFDSLDRS